MPGEHWERHGTHGSYPARGNTPSSEAPRRRAVCRVLATPGTGALPVLVGRPLHTAASLGSSCQCHSSSSQRPCPQGPLSSRPCLSPADTVGFLDTPCPSAAPHHSPGLRPHAPCARGALAPAHSRLPQPLPVTAGVTGLCAKPPLTAETELPSGARGGSHTPKVPPMFTFSPRHRRPRRRNRGPRGAQELRSRLANCPHALPSVPTL